MKRLYFFFLYVTTASGMYAQNEMVVPYQSLLAVNPSFAGSNGFIRNQASIDLPSSRYYRMQNSLDTYLPGIKSGVGFTAMRSNLNDVLRTSELSLAYAKYFALKNKLTLVPSLQAGYTLREVNMGWIYPAPSIPGSGSNAWQGDGYFRAGAGMLVNYKNFYGGVSLSSFNYPVLTANRRSNVYSDFKMHASYNFHVNEDLLLHGYAHYFSRLAYGEVLVAVNAAIDKHVIVGAGYSTYSDAFSANAGYRAEGFTLQLACKKTYQAFDMTVYTHTWQLLASFNLSRTSNSQTLPNLEAW